MIARISVSNMAGPCISPGGVFVSPGGGGGGDATPIVGMSPAKAETARTQVRITAIPSRFIGFLLFENYQKSGIARYQKHGIGK